jgi:hypothetical protein
MASRQTLTPPFAAKRNFHRHGSRTSMIAKFVIGLDEAAPPLAGLSGRGRFHFLSFDAIGAALWAGTYTGLGYVFSKDLDRAISYVSSLGKVFAALFEYVDAQMAVQEEVITWPERKNNYWLDQKRHAAGKRQSLCRWDIFELLPK